MMHVDAFRCMFFIHFWTWWSRGNPPLVTGLLFDLWVCRRIQETEKKRKQTLQQYYSGYLSRPPIWHLCYVLKSELYSTYAM